MSKNKLGKLGLYYVLIVTISGILIIGAMINIQFINGDMWREKASKRLLDVQNAPAHRGTIYSSDGKIIATTIPVADLYMDFGREVLRNSKNEAKTDKHGNIISQSMISDSNFFGYLDSVCAKLHEAFPNTPASEFRKKIVDERSKNKPKRCCKIQRNLPYSYWKDICSYPGWDRIVVKTIDDTVSVIRGIRAHTYKNLAENTIGFSNGQQSHSYTGLEGKYDSLLRGQDGEILCRRLTKGIWIPVANQNKNYLYQSRDIMVDSVILKPMIDGCDIISTIDTRYQDVAESALRSTMERIGGFAGCAVLMEIETGYVLANASLTKDTHTHTYREMPNSNVAVSDRYEPGSTFKTVILTAMLNDPTIHIDTADRYRVGTKDYGCVNGKIKDSHVSRDTASVHWILAHSSNVGMCELGWKYYWDKNDKKKKRIDVLRNNVEKIFPPKTLNLDVIASEPRSFINDLHASPSDFLRFCFGYSTAVTPMQVLTFYNAIGGNGRMVKPLFCKAIINQGHRETISPVVLKDSICRPEALATIRSLLLSVVEEGTGKSILPSEYGIAGKTGTSWSSYGKYPGYNASFVGYFPAENPKYSCLVLVRGTSGYGNSVAPVFRSISDCVMATDRTLGNLKIADSLTLSHAEDHFPYVTKGRQQRVMRAYDILRLPYRSSDSVSRWVVYQPADTTQGTRGEYNQYKLAQGKVPDCSGMSAREATALLRSQGMRVQFEGCGKVIRQTPNARTKAPRGTTVRLTLGTK